MWIALILVAAGVALSAFFSGSETGFYRVTRVRLAIDAKRGGFVARALHWLVSKASLVVATVLIGNNIANYLVSFGLVLLSHQILAADSELESLLPVLMTPVLFIYGELLPKYLYYQVPYRLLQWGAPLMLVCTLLFLPVSIFVLLLDAVWRWLLGAQANPRASTLERQELQRVLVEGQEAGVVLPIQREIAQNLFTFGGRPIRQFAQPLQALASVPENATREEVLQRSQATGQNIVGVFHANGKQLVGCYVVAELLLRGPTAELQPQPICQALATESNIQVLTRMHSQHFVLVQVFDAHQRLLGIVTRERLTSLLLADS